MGYNITGTSGNDRLDLSSQAGPDTIVGLVGDDYLMPGSGLTTATGDSGADTVHVLFGLNTWGTARGGTGDDHIFNGGTGSMELYGNSGADSIFVDPGAPSQSIYGGDDSSDAGDWIQSGNGADFIFGNGGDDTIRGAGGNNTVIGGTGDDSLLTGTDNDFIYAGEGNDTIWAAPGFDTVYAGEDNDSIYVGTSAVQTFGLIFCGAGSDTLGARDANGPLIVVGGADSSDAADSLVAGSGNDFLFGNGGADTIDTGNGLNSVVAGVGSDSVVGGDAADQMLGNENNDTLVARDGNNTVVGGIGDDYLVTGQHLDWIAGNEDNDTVIGGFGADTLAGGSGRDRFVYLAPNEDGFSTAVGSGFNEMITDLDWNDDRFDVLGAITSVAVRTVTGAASLADAAQAALAGQQATGGTPNAAAQFDFGGHTFVVINQDAALGFADQSDLLIDITGATGTINLGAFV